jgi:Centromere DNA-binding protein complex CBF3 subunit, domain 2
VPLVNKGPTPCFTIIIIIDNGKTNPLGRLKYRAVIRYYNSLLYTIAYTAFYLFYY